MNRHKKYLSDRMWDSPDSIVYTFNSHGFRTNEFDNRPSYLALGCSFTEGIGLPDNYTWPALLSQKINYPVWNLGIGGASLDTCYRVLVEYIDLLNLVGIVLLDPPKARMDIKTGGTWKTLTPNNYNDSEIYKVWISDEENIQTNVDKNLSAMKNVCLQRNIKFFNFLAENTGIPGDLARDMLHNGIATQEFISNKFENLISQQR